MRCVVSHLLRFAGGNLPGTSAPPSGGRAWGKAPVLQYLYELIPSYLCKIRRRNAASASSKEPELVATILTVAGSVLGIFMTMPSSQDAVLAVGADHCQRDVRLPPLRSRAHHCRRERLMARACGLVRPRLLCAGETVASRPAGPNRPEQNKRDSVMRSF